VLPLGFPAEQIVQRCSDFVEVTGRIGDVILLHPFMLHTRSINVRSEPRFIINPPVQLREPMCFAREQPADHSPVEQAVLRALGVERYEFALAHPREAVVPPRLAREQREWAERARLAESRSS
jgi:hypothetical protein